MRRTGDYRYELPHELIARAPAEPADASRLLVSPADGSLEHKRFTDLPTLLQPDDVLVVNETHVIRARLHGTRERGGAAEVLLLRPLDAPRYDPRARRWEALVRPGRKLREGARVEFGADGACTVAAVQPNGIREIVFDEGVELETLLERRGEMPLPPYVGEGDAARAARYQTMFARVPGSVAAPTASLHFTPAVVAALAARGVQIVPLELDVGYGTFKPIETETIDEHPMHAERFALSAPAADAINCAKRDGRRIVAAGTTVLRALESAALLRDAADAERSDSVVAAFEGDTALYVTPGFEFRVVDVLLTNFHLPASSLLVLVAAFAGYDRTMDAYRTAISERYRFYSFGDAMLIER